MSAAADRASTYRQAARLIRDGGWVQNTYELGPSHCTAGALMAVKGVDMWMVGTVRPEVRYLADLLGWRGEWEDGELGLYTVTSWNDEADRTPEDVITLFEQAAEKLEADL